MLCWVKSLALSQALDLLKQETLYVVKELLLIVSSKR